MGKIWDLIKLIWSKEVCTVDEFKAAYELVINDIDENGDNKIQVKEILLLLFKILTKFTKNRK